MNIIMETLAESIHEGSAGRNTIGVKVCFLGLLRRQVGAFGLQLGADTGDLVNLLLGLLGGTEAARALLVHFSARSLEHSFTDIILCYFYKQIIPVFRIKWLTNGFMEVKKQ